MAYNTLQFVLIKLFNSFRYLYQFKSASKCIWFTSGCVSDSHLITNWKVGHRVGSILYHKTTGTVEIKRQGYYFIYSQMFYYDGETYQMAHDTYINNDKVMESVASVINQTKKYNTKYHGGVFLLRANDTISVRVPYTSCYNMDSLKSFFGAFLIHPTDD